MIAEPSGRRPLTRVPALHASVTSAPVRSVRRSSTCTTTSGAVPRPSATVYGCGPLTSTTSPSRMCTGSSASGTIGRAAYGRRERERERGAVDDAQSPERVELGAAERGGTRTQAVEEIRKRVHAVIADGQTWIRARQIWISSQLHRSLDHERAAGASRDEESMFTITGATGHVGEAAADVLLGRGAPVRVVLRDAARASEWTARGAEAAIADLADTAALTAALRLRHAADGRAAASIAAAVGERTPVRRHALVDRGGPARRDWARPLAASARAGAAGHWCRDHRAPLVTFPGEGRGDPAGGARRRRLPGLRQFSRRDDAEDRHGGHRRSRRRCAARGTGGERGRRPRRAGLDGARGRRRAVGAARPRVAGRDDLRGTAGSPRWSARD